MPDDKEEMGMHLNEKKIVSTERTFSSLLQN